MNNRILLVLIALLGSLVWGGCDTTSAADSPVSWIDAPHNGSSYDMQAIQVISHSNDPGGLAQVEISANGKIIETQPASGTFAQTTVKWYPDGPGNYLLHVRAQNAAGAWGSYAEANVSIGAETPTLVPTNSPTPIITVTQITPAPVTGNKLFFKANKSASQIYYGNCGTNSVTIQAYASDINLAKSITLFINLKDQKSGATTGWDGGQSMNPAGNGWFQRTINSTSIANYNKYSNSWVLYQFVASGSDNAVVGKSSVYSDIALSGCAAPPIRIEPPKVAPIVTLTPKKVIAPPKLVVPTKTLIPGPK
jgi:hypothetical protein